VQKLGEAAVFAPGRSAAITVPEMGLNAQCIRRRQWGCRVCVEIPLQAPGGPVAPGQAQYRHHAGETRQVTRMLPARLCFFPHGCVSSRKVVFSVSSAQVSLRNGVPR